MHNVIEGIDNSPIEQEELKYAQAGDFEKSWEKKQEFLKNAAKLSDHCSCPEACPHHGNCYECVILHRGHGDHLPYCMWGIVNKKIASLSQITEGSVKEEL
jgi:hypothetical protein